MISQLDEILKEFLQTLNGIKSQPEVLNLKSTLLGKKGRVSQILSGLKSATAEERKKIGSKANQIKEEIQNHLNKKLSDLELEVINKKLSEKKIDFSYTDSIKADGMFNGGYHPVTIVQREIEDIFLSMGFEILDGPHIEDEHHNFEALNIPADHPARDMTDTFWFHDPHDDSIKDKYLLRTHTSTIQIHGLSGRKPPFKFIAPGKAFRAERTDASHEVVFHQLEGMLVGENISVANLIYFMKTILSEIFKKDVEVRLRPGFFPFVEPGFELDIKCLICGGKGCSVCKQVGWVELLPCGMVHPNVLKDGGIDTEKYNGFAFGLGLDRLVMMRYGIDDIRHLHGADLRFITQFKSY